MDDVYAIKYIHFLGKPVTYICQNVNGPCPLLAICNVLLLRGHISIEKYITKSHDIALISARDLITVVQKRLHEANPPLPESNPLGRLTQKKTLQDITELLPSLLVGLDVNVKFHSITDFEYTIACAVFDMLDISLVHGWLVDIQDETTVMVIRNRSYNELIERLVDYRGVMITESHPDQEETLAKEMMEINSNTDMLSTPTNLTISSFSSLQIDTTGISPSPRSSKGSPSKATVDTLKRERQLSDTDAIDTATTLLEEGPILETFFATSASQLTYYGLIKLHEDLRERQLCVFFRNNHFSTLFKYENELYLLVTDAGYLEESSVVWERLNQIDGDTEYRNEVFGSLVVEETKQQTLISQQEESRQRQVEDVTPSNREDFQLALKIQKEEEEALARAVAHTQDGTREQSPRRVSGKRSPSRSPRQQTQPRQQDVEFVVGDDGQLVVSEAELQAQREAELYYQQQRSQPAQPAPTVTSRAMAAMNSFATPGRNAPSREQSKRDECILM